MYDYFNYFVKWELKRCNGWTLEFCFLPKRCSLSGKRIWLKKAYRGRCVITGPGDGIVVTHYIEKFEFVKWQLGV